MKIADAPANGGAPLELPSSNGFTRRRPAGNRVASSPTYSRAATVLFPASETGRAQAAPATIVAFRSRESCAVHRGWHLPATPR